MPESFEELARLAITNFQESLRSITKHFHDIEAAVNALNVDMGDFADAIHKLDGELDDLSRDNVHDLKARMDFTSEVPSPDGSKDRDE